MFGRWLMIFAQEKTVPRNERGGEKREFTFELKQFSIKQRPPETIIAALSKTECSLCISYNKCFYFTVELVVIAYIQSVLSRWSFAMPVAFPTFMQPFCLIIRQKHLKFQIRGPRRRRRRWRRRPLVTMEATEERNRKLPDRMTQNTIIVAISPKVRRWRRGRRTRGRGRESYYTLKRSNKVIMLITLCGSENH